MAYIYGSSSKHDVLFGTLWDDVIRGFDGDDFLYGYDGDDVLYGDAGSDYLYGHEGNDILYGGGREDFLSGGPGNDRLYGGGWNDRLYGGGGDDWLYGESGNDFLYGNSGDDYLSGGYGNDRLYGGAGNDTLYGGGDNDVLYGDGGDDALHGDTGNDYLYGSFGEDELEGGGGDDFLYGELDSDTLTGGTGNDRLEGGGGFDRYVFRSGDGADILIDWNTDYDGASGGDTLVFSDTGITGLRLARTLTNSDDMMVYYSGGVVTVRNQYKASGGVDLIEIEGRTYHFNVGIDSIYSDDMVHGTSARDLLYGGGADDWLYGYGGEDHLFGEGGNDHLFGGAANDHLYGGGGSDSYEFVPGDGLDTVTEGVGSLGDVDTVAFTGVSVTDLSLSWVSDDLIVSYGSGDAVTVTDQSYFRQDGGVEKVELDGRAYSFQVGDGLGVGEHWVSGTSSDDLLYGGYNGEDYEYLDSGAGSDVLFGGQGMDWLLGGSGNDIYVVNRYDGSDRISDVGGSRDLDALYVKDFDWAEITVERTINLGQDLVIRFGTGGDQVSVIDQFDTFNPAQGIERIALGNQAVSLQQLDAVLDRVGDTAEFKSDASGAVFVRETFADAKSGEWIELQAADPNQSV